MRARVWPILMLAVACGGTTKKTSGPGAKLTPKDIVKQASPAIVQIETPPDKTPRPRASPLELAQTRLGTGFIIDKSGIIATNLHVVSGKKQIHVKLYGGDTYDVQQVVGVDPGRDLALLKIAVPKPLPTVKLGDSDALSAGDAVVAIGNPLGMEYTVSAGLVSQVRPLCTKEAVAYHDAHKRRFEELVDKVKTTKLTSEEVEELSKLQCVQELTLLQISAPISHGSSGGPLFNQAGEVVGVTTAIVDEGQNINFAVPTNYIKPIVQHPLKLSLDEFAQKTADQPSRRVGTRVREIPEHDPAVVFKGCTGQQIADVVQQISDAISVGAPAYNDGRIEECFHVYERTAALLEKYAPCQGVRTAFGDGLLKAGTKQEFDDKAWTMRDTFDGLLKAADDWAQAPGNQLPKPKSK